MGAIARGRRLEPQLSFLDRAGNVVPPPKKPRKRTRGVKLGRPPRAERRGFVPHAKRVTHEAAHPVHVSMRRVRLAPSLRDERIYAAILTQLAWAKSRGVRVVHHSVQHDHVHLIVEAKNRQELSSDMRKLFSRIARAVNSVALRRGSLFRDRHHRVELTSPTQTRRALVYVLFNDRKHHAQNGGNISEALLGELDACSSVAWLDEWSEKARPPPDVVARLRARNVDPVTRQAPITPARTWLASHGWFQRGGGRMRLDELPRFL